MENFAPGLREGVLSVTESLRVIVYFLCVAGLILQIQQARLDAEGLSRPIVRAAIVVGLVATLPYWFAFAERVFLSIANAVCAGYTDHPMQTAAKLRGTVSGSPTGFSLTRVGESLYQAFLYAAGKLVVLVASLLQLPFLILQFILKYLCYLFLPVALGFFMIPSQAHLGARYLQQTLAVLAWPVGFAATELVAYHLLTAYADNLATAYDLLPGDIDSASFASLLGGLLAAIWIIIGTIATPFLMQGLICSGTPMSGGGGMAMGQIYALQHLLQTMKAFKTAGVVGSLFSAKSGTSEPPTPPPPAPTTPPPPTPVAPVTSNQGDDRAAAALALAQLPTARTTI